MIVNKMLMISIKIQFSDDNTFFIYIFSIQDVLIESDIVAAGSINGMLSGKHYNQEVRVHKLIYEG